MYWRYFEPYLSLWVSVIQIFATKSHSFGRGLNDRKYQTGVVFQNMQIKTNFTIIFKYHLRKRLQSQNLIYAPVKFMKP